MTNKQAYINYCARNPGSINLFSRPDWLDIVCKNWDVLFEEQKQLFLVHQIETKLAGSLRFYRNPHLSPYTALHGTINESTEESLKSLVSQLRSCSSLIDLDIDYNHQLNFEDSENIFSEGVKLKQVHTRVIDCGLGINGIKQNYKSSLQRQLNKSLKTLKIWQTLNASDFYDFWIQQANKVVGMPKFSKVMIEQLLKYCRTHNCGTVLLAKEKETDALLGFTWIVWDAQRAYYLCGARKEPYSEAAAALLNNAIEITCDKGLSTFYFEGSSIAGIDRFFSNFGAHKQVYYRICYKSNFVKMLHKLKG